MKWREVWRYIHTLGHPYKASGWRSKYAQIAFICGSTPDHVYRLAHGKEPETDEDWNIISELVENKILIERKH